MHSTSIWTSESAIQSIQLFHSAARFPVMLHHDSIFSGQGYQELLALTFSASVAKYELPNERCLSSQLLPGGEKPIFKQGSFYQRETLCRHTPCLEISFNLWRKTQKWNFIPVVFILSRNAMQISKSFFQDAKKVSKGGDH